MKTKFVLASIAVAVAGTAGSASGSVPGKPVDRKPLKMMLYHAGGNARTTTVYALVWNAGRSASGKYVFFVNFGLKKVVAPVKAYRFKFVGGKPVLLRAKRVPVTRFLDSYTYKVLEKSPGLYPRTGVAMFLVFKKEDFAEKDCVGGNAAVLPYKGPPLMGDRLC